jgi:hypothetical protein
MMRRLVHVATVVSAVLLVPAVAVAIIAGRDRQEDTAWDPPHVTFGPHLHIGFDRYHGSYGPQLVLYRDPGRPFLGGTTGIVGAGWLPDGSTIPLPRKVGPVTIDIPRVFSTTISGTNTPSASVRCPMVPGATGPSYGTSHPLSGLSA